MAKKRHLARGGRHAAIPGAALFSVGALLAQLQRIAPPLKTPTEPPWRALPWLLLLAFVLRAIVSLAGDFVIHPDEIMQYLEPAHGLVYGSSVAYWEYYYGARSWLVPGAIAAVLYAANLVGLDSPHTYVAAVKLFFCLLSLFIPLSLYVVGRRLFSELSARAALLLGVFWYELVGFAHKPMTEFIATSLLFLLLLLAFRPQPLTMRQAAGAALLGVFVVAVRFQYAPIAALILLAPFARADNAARAAMALVAAAAVLAVGLFDYATWGGFLHPYWLNLQTNIVLNEFRSEESSALHYLGWLVAGSGGFYLLSFAAMANTRRRWFFLLLAVVILLPHMLQAHREYRFIFVLLPFMLLLAADLMASGWQASGKALAKLPQRLLSLRMLLGLGAAALVSTVGIANALPFQYWVYKAHSQETGLVHFLHSHDEVFSVYKRLAADDSVRGVYDVTRPYFNTGGYYYLHRQVPFYSANTGRIIPLARMAAHVSHIVAPPLVTPLGVAQTSNNRVVMQTEEGAHYPVPGYISDASLNKLVYWDQNARPTAIDGFTAVYQSAKFTIWRAEGSGDSAEGAGGGVRDWQAYHIAPDSEAMHRVIKRAIGEKNAKAPADNFGIVYKD